MGMGLYKTDTTNRMITLSVITLSGFHCIWKSLHLNQQLKNQTTKINNKQSRIQRRPQNTNNSKTNDDFHLTNIITQVTNDPDIDKYTTDFW